MRSNYHIRNGASSAWNISTYLITWMIPAPQVSNALRIRIFISIVSRFYQLLRSLLRSGVLGKGFLSSARKIGYWCVSDVLGIRRSVAKPPCKLWSCTSMERSFQCSGLMRITRAEIHKHAEPCTTRSRGISITAFDVLLLALGDRRRNTFKDKESSI